MKGGVSGNLVWTFGTEEGRVYERMIIGPDIPIHRHPTEDESFVILRGKVRSTTYNDDGSVIESVVLCQEDGV